MILDDSGRTSCLNIGDLNLAALLEAEMLCQELFEGSTPSQPLRLRAMQAQLEVIGNLGCKIKKWDVEPYLLLIFLALEFDWQDSRLAIWSICNNMKPRNVRMAAVFDLISGAHVVYIEWQDQQPTVSGRWDGWIMTDYDRLDKYWTHWARKIEVLTHPYST